MADSAPRIEPTSSYDELDAEVLPGTEKKKPRPKVKSVTDESTLIEHDGQEGAETHELDTLA